MNPAREKSPQASNSNVNRSRRICDFCDEKLLDLCNYNNTPYAICHPCQELRRGRNDSFFNPELDPRSSSNMPDPRHSFPGDFLSDASNGNQRPKIGSLSQHQQQYYNQAPHPHPSHPHPQPQPQHLHSSQPQHQQYQQHPQHHQHHPHQHLQHPGGLHMPTSNSHQAPLAMEGRPNPKRSKQESSNDVPILNQNYPELSGMNNLMSGPPLGLVPEPIPFVADVLKVKCQPRKTFRFRYNREKRCTPLTGRKDGTFPTVVVTEAFKHAVADEVPIVALLVRSKNDGNGNPVRHCHVLDYENSVVFLQKGEAVFQKLVVNREKLKPSGDGGNVKAKDGKDDHLVVRIMFSVAFTTHDGRKLQSWVCSEPVYGDYIRVNHISQESVYAHDYSNVIWLTSKIQKKNATVFVQDQTPLTKEDCELLVSNREKEGFQWEFKDGFATVTLFPEIPQGNSIIFGFPPLWKPNTKDTHHVQVKVIAFASGLHLQSDPIPMKYLPGSAVQKQGASDVANESKQRQYSKPEIVGCKAVLEGSQALTLKTVLLRHLQGTRTSKTLSQSTVGQEMSTASPPSVTSASTVSSQDEWNVQDPSVQQHGHPEKEPFPSSIWLG